jgi:hypothetical protein
MKSIASLLILLPFAAQAQWSSSGDGSRGTQFYTSGGVLGYSIRTHTGGGWSWQLIDGSNNSYFHVQYPTGNVGMGTSTPGTWFSSRTLEIFGNRPVLKLTAESAAGLGTFVFTNASVNPSTHHGEFHINHQFDQSAHEKSKIRFNSYPASDLLTLQADGNVGVGTSSPTHRLTIAGPASGALVQQDIFNPSTNSGSVAGLRFHTASGWNIMLRTRQDGAWLELADGNGQVFQTWQEGSYFPTGNIGIGTTNTGPYRLAVEGKIGAREVNVTTTSWSDHVFSKDYQLRPLNEVQKFITENHHLPDVPSEKEVLANGQNLGEMNALLLKKIEELTLYLIEQKNEILALRQELEIVKNSH